MRKNVWKVLGIVAALSPVPAGAASAQTGDFNSYVQCNFRPQIAACRKLRDGAENSPAAEAVKAAYDGYGRYLLAPSAALTEADRHYLDQNGIRMPEGLSPADLSGLHHVINDPVTAADETARRIAVNNFLTRAVSAELYCSFNSCSPEGV
ncbi:MAG TPA: hypothetical protein VG798_01400 [Rhizomicrobium sp.]|nr:hypothetical protein [Rhizomicrobium sp.]